MKLFLIVFFIFSSILFSQTTSITGNVKDKETGKSIPFVNIGVKE